jgi:hypothetical protein
VVCFNCSDGAIVQGQIRSGEVSEVSLVTPLAQNYMVQLKSCRENQATRLMFNNCFFFETRTVQEIMWKSVIDPASP